MPAKTTPPKISGQGQCDRLPTAIIGITIPSAIAKSQGTAVPPMHEVDALIDTGACISGIREGALPFSWQPLPGPGVNLKIGSEDNWRPVFMASVQIGSKKIEALQIASYPSDFQFDAIIGEDILCRCMLVYDGPADNMSLELIQERQVPRH